MDFIKKIVSKVSGLWKKWSMVQKIILAVIVIVVIASLSAVVSINSGPASVALYPDLSLTEEQVEELKFTLNSMNVPFTVSANNNIRVESEFIARKIRTELIVTNNVPGQQSGFDILGTPSFTETQWDKEQKLQQAVKRQLEMHIETLDSIDDASVTIVIPEKELFKENQKPNTVSVSLRAKHGSNFSSDRRQIEGVERLIMNAVVNLKKENITILDRSTGKILNNFEDLAEFDRLTLGNKEMDQKTRFESKYEEKILEALHSIFTPERVALAKVDITLNTDVVEIAKEEHTPIVTTKDNPATSYSEEVNQESIEISRSVNNTEFQGSGFTPEGPAGQEGQTPPQYKELDTMAGTYTQNSETINKVVNTVKTREVKSQWKREKIGVAVNLDGKWEKIYNEDGTIKMENGKIVRNFIPLTKEEIDAATALIKGAINYDIQNGDSVTVQAIQFDRSNEFELEDKLERDAQNRKRIILFSILGLVLIVIAFIIMRMVAKELERRRRLKEEEMARQHQAMREAALRSAEEDGMEVEMSVEDRARLEMQEHAINVAREHPEDVAQLIRTWLAEE